MARYPRSHPKTPIINRIAPPERRRVLQGRLRLFIPRYYEATPEHTHHALEIVERLADSVDVPVKALDSDEWVIGFLFARAEHKYGTPAVDKPDWFNDASTQGYDAYYKLVGYTPIPLPITA